MTVDEAMEIVVMDDFRSEQEATLANEVVRLRGETDRLGGLLRAKQQRVFNTEAEIDRLRLQRDNDALNSLDYGVCKASLVQARAQRDAFRIALERIEDDADCTDLEECKEVAREALEL